MNEGKVIPLSSNSKQNGDDQDPRPKIVVLIGDIVGSGTGLGISDYLGTRFSDRYRASIIYSHKDEEILDVLNSIDIDVSILILNNILHGFLGGDFRTDASVKLSALIKDSGRPVIALSSIQDPAHVEAAKLASHYYFSLPPHLVPVGDAFEKILEGNHDKH
jgi:hypothetical protein